MRNRRNTFAAIVTAALIAGSGCSFILDPDDLGRGGLRAEAPVLIEGTGAFANTPGQPVVVRANLSLIDNPPECELSTPSASYCFTDSCTAAGTTTCDPLLCEVVEVSDNEREAGLIVRLPMWESEADATLTITVAGRSIELDVQARPELVVGDGAQGFDTAPLDSINNASVSCMQIGPDVVDVVAMQSTPSADPISAPLRLQASAGFIFVDNGRLNTDARDDLPGISGYWGGGLEEPGFGPGGGAGGMTSAGVAAHANGGRCDGCPGLPDGKAIYNQVARLVGGSGGGGVENVAGGNGGGAMALLTPGAIVMSDGQGRTRDALAVQGRCREAATSCGSSAPSSCARRPSQASSRSRQPADF